MTALDHQPFLALPTRKIFRKVQGTSGHAFRPPFLHFSDQILSPERRLFSFGIPLSVLGHLLLVLGIFCWNNLSQEIPVPAIAIEVVFVAPGENSGGPLSSSTPSGSSLKSLAGVSSGLPAVPKQAATKPSVVPQTDIEEKTVSKEAQPDLPEKITQEAPLDTKGEFAPPVQSVQLAQITQPKPAPRERPQRKEILKPEALPDSPIVFDKQNIPRLLTDTLQPSTAADAGKNSISKSTSFLKKNSGAEGQSLNKPTEKIAGENAGGGDGKQGAGSKPGFKIGSLANPLPAYPKKARRRGMEGRVLLRVEVDKLGSVTSIDISTSSGHRLLDKVAKKTVKKWRFTPASVAGHPVSGHILVPISFLLT